MIIPYRFFLCCFVFISIGFHVLGQVNEKLDLSMENDSLVNEDNTYAFVERMPAFVGGKDSLNAYLKKVVSRIELKSANKLKGRVLVDFIVTRSGHIYRPRIIRGASKELNEAAIQIVSSFPLWEPGKQSGKAMNVLLHLPIDF